MRPLVLVLVLLNLIVLYSLWFGKSGWERVAELEQGLPAQTEINNALLARNNAMYAQVQDLKTGTQAIEERARSELGMLREDEIFVQVLPQQN